VIREIVMMRLVWLLGAFLLAGMVAPSAFAKGPFGKIHVGDWVGGAFTNDKTGAFSHCTAFDKFRDGTILGVSQSADGTWFITFTNESWRMALQEAVSVALIADGRAHDHLFVKVVSPKTMIAILPNTLLQSFRKSQLMIAEVNGQTIQFQLTRADQLIPTISNCVTKTRAAGVAAAGDFSATVPQQGAVAQQIPDDGSASKLVSKSGTGFVISSSGHIVTNNHVIDGCVSDIHGSLIGEGEIALRVVSTDEFNDLALLKAAKSFNDVARIRATAVRSGDAVVAIGYPFHGLLTSDFTVTTGIVSSLSGLLNDTRYLQISAAVQSGNSGGPLLDTSGNVVGVVAAKLNALKVARATGDLPENINFAIKTGVVRDFLDNSAVSYQTADSVQDRKTADIATSARAYTMLISCSANEKEKR
jgi:S1-C subfamily serine protease